MARVLLEFFAVENRIYGRALVTAFTVSAGVKTAVKADLYAGLTGAATLPNPITLGSNGRVTQPVYIDQDVILTIAAVHAASHDTGIVSVPADLSSELTIASGVITITSNAPVVHHTVDTESDASTDDLDTINGAAFTGQVLILQAADDARTVSATEAGNIALASAPRALDHTTDVLTLVYNGSSWCEQSFGDNG